MRKREPIKTVAYCHVGDQLVNMDDLTPEQQNRAANWLATTYLNELYRGIATFEVAEDLPTAEARTQA